jgi:ATP-dependent DNA ligase
MAETRAIFRCSSASGRLRTLVPRAASRLRYLEHVRRRGRDLFNVICDRGLEGMVGKLAASRYVKPPPPWVKMLNPAYSQKHERHDLFERRT